MNSENSIKKLTDKLDCFHDYRLGFFDIKENTVSVILEEDMRTKDNAGAKKAKYTINDYSDLEISLDCICSPYVMDIRFENENVIIFELTNGCISMKCRNINLEV